MNDIIFVGKHLLTFTVDRHFHKSWELIYCTGGEGELVLEDRVISYRENDLLVIPPKTSHTNRSESGFTNIHMDIVDASFSFDGTVLLRFPAENYVLPAFQAAYYFYSNGGLGQTTILPVYGKLIATMIQASTADVGRSDVVRRITDHILKNYPDPAFDLNAYLESFSFSTEYLKKLFRKEVGITPRQYLTERRLENAAHTLALTGGGQNIAQIARQCGFNDPLYFSKLFKRQYGVSPKFYQPSKLGPPSADSDDTKIIVSDDPDNASSKQL